ncbi:GNAT family N-acetyltransferase [Paenibacillus sp. CF384]|uniref:GNAT family N-acetyltransferase n=1 Tax=Paenibacillus sp. CF384 TaxID=1884382 RepID=UPI000899936B|nr:GNAT family N-acetyltransferase [Paenibacillus sp. CF384]SDX04075.1 Ribosomal protein S18 acetylase RimI [Paenibacillus sp. CF384]
MITTEQLRDIEQLQIECEAHDHMQLKLNWEMLRERESDRLDLFHYENEQLIAFVGLYAFGSTVEVCGMVKPSERRTGHFQRLFRQAMEKVHQNGFKRILLNAPAGSDAARAFLRKQGAEYAFSEHQMEWQEKSLGETDGITLRPATPEDYEMRVRISVQAFGDDEADAHAMESRVYAGNTDVYMIGVNEETVGKIRVSREEGQAWIYGFAILPEHQGKGIGSKVLRRVIHEQRAAGYSVHLEVETKNDHALRLYESVGFKVVHAQDYYSYHCDESNKGIDSEDKV